MDILLVTGRKYRYSYLHSRETTQNVNQRGFELLVVCQKRLFAETQLLKRGSLSSTKGFFAKWTTVCIIIHFEQYLGFEINWLDTTRQWSVYTSTFKRCWSHIFTQRQCVCGTRMANKDFIIRDIIYCIFHTKKKKSNTVSPRFKNKLESIKIYSNMFEHVLDNPICLIRTGLNG